MTEQLDDKSAGRAERDSAKVPAGSARAWLPAVLTLLGSTGIVSVFGPLTGELYWEGYLAAFGLTAQEFPAVPAHVSKFAYRAILEWANSVLLEVWRLLPYVIGALVIAVVGSALFKLPGLKSRLRSIATRVHRRYSSENPMGWALQASAKLVLMLVSLMIVGYVSLMLILLLISPNQAKQLGFREGERHRQAYASAAPGSLSCDTIEASGFVFTCPTVVVYGDKTLAARPTEGLSSAAGRDEGELSHAYDVVILQ